MSLIALSAGTTARVNNDHKVEYDHTKFNEEIEVVIKMLDRLDHYDRIFAIE